MSISKLPLSKYTPAMFGDIAIDRKSVLENMKKDIENVIGVQKYEHLEVRDNVYVVVGVTTGYDMDDDKEYEKPVPQEYGIALRAIDTLLKLWDERRYTV